MTNHSTNPGSFVDRCAYHPERTAVGTCLRCGTFACETCYRHEPGRCERCVGIGAIPWEDSGPWLRRMVRTLVVLARRPGPALADAARLGKLGRSLAFGSITLVSIVALSSGLPLSVTVARAGRLVAAGGLDDSATSVLTSLLVIDLILAPLKIGAVLMAHAVRATAFAIAAWLVGARGHLRDIVWLEGYLMIGAAPLTVVLLAAVLVRDPRVMILSALVASFAQEAWIAAVHRSFATRRLGLSTRAALIAAWGPALLFIALAGLGL